MLLMPVKSETSCYGCLRKVAFIKTKRLDKGLVTLESSDIGLLPLRYLGLSYRLEAFRFNALSVKWLNVTGR